MKKVLERNQYWILAIIWLVVINFTAFIWHLGSTSLVDETEPLFAEAARQMTVTNNWITPYFNGETRFDKPPLVYWLMVIGYQLIGVNEWAVRLPSALSAIALTVFGFYTLKYWGIANFKKQGLIKKKQLWLSAIIGSGLMTFNPHTIIWGRTGVSDMLLSGCMGSALFCFFWGYVTSVKRYSLSDINQRFVLPNKWYLAFYILLGLAVLAKGPVGIVLPGLIIFCFLIYIGQFWQVVREIKLLWGAIIFLTITIPWYVLVWLENGQDYLDTFFGYHNFQRFTDVVNGHEAPWYFYFLIVFILLAPWSVYLPVAIANMRWWQRKYWAKQPRQNHLGIFAFFWFICIFLFFSASVTKLPSYVLPLVPAAAILVALMWSNFITNSNFKIKKINHALLASIIINLILVIALAIAFYLSPNWVGKDPATPKLSRLVAESSLPISGTIVWGLIAIAIAFCLTKIKFWRGIIAVNLIGFMAFISFVLIPTTFFIDIHRQVTLKEIAGIITEIQQSSEPIFLVGFKKPSLVFYTQQPVSFFKRRSDLRTHLAENQSNINSATVLIVGRTKDIEKIVNLEPDTYNPLDSRGVYNLIRIPFNEIQLDES
ncbi:PMT family glycosyltransferase, 4-amino-4-deoxy-L-arabinose transferase [Hyella patelloides LEGE 07179]|uniref:PMT family glycosyltransferase, 4-amino-4-deoxy-L-arabinose transferase n=1 Tax=Hyella patelloides LEGE 07179 TaxID=945734 RepID=A0A563W0B5_9CYAN|nr:glycosyltransferase family 39 protein [Hyella patelloides]VEP16963.1 PMT family glycosyltransferase, 4-amino-4-deoxy-L-arabinose transferase [Hyella patelloides LEGE 07179]